MTSNCPTCGAVDDEPCNWKRKATQRFHKARVFEIVEPGKLPEPVVVTEDPPSGL